MARQPRKRTASKSAIRPMQSKRQMRRALADDPRVRALRRRRWAHLRALAKDDAFRDETKAVRSGLNAAYGFDPATVDAFMERFWYPSPAVYLKARQFLERIQGSALRATLLRYLEYASRFGVYMVRRAREERTKFAVRGIVPRGEKFHVCLVEDHLEPAAGMPEDEPFVEYVSSDTLPVVPELQKAISEGAARFVQIEDDSCVRERYEPRSLLSQVHPWCSSRTCCHRSVWNFRRLGMHGHNFHDGFSAFPPRVRAFVEPLLEVSRPGLVVFQHSLGRFECGFRQLVY